ncbi:DUF2795 domain-containing protein [Paramicrobacterium agarici]|uniref:Uncharacterized protein DUF2795 n=1 Tax=Paramicrobacterium agarici TaxID=630514 RepID=A0A2A9E0Q4_9MICO|nr:DUF2795 domain-containing protein [Microbacterium agarici]PFG31955.1 uncharacterized protein DUF2795 [Microbacterium agarici]TQO21846.1 uncharacterized protein DUF2795 [Microbacterium agarici]
MKRILSTQMTMFLQDMEYPCDRDDLLREAKAEGLSTADRKLLEHLESRLFSSRWDIRRALATSSTASARQTRNQQNASPAGREVVSV